MKYRKAEALAHYAIMITIVVLALVAMQTYLRRSIQAKVKDLTDNIICEKQLASLYDLTEKSTKDSNSTYSLQKVEGTGGISSLNTTSAYTVQMEHEVKDPVKIDFDSPSPSSGTNYGFGCVNYGNYVQVDTD